MSTSSSLTLCEESRRVCEEEGGATAAPENSAHQQPENPLKLKLKKAKKDDKKIKWTEDTVDNEGKKLIFPESLFLNPHGFESLISLKTLKNRTF